MTQPAAGRRIALVVAGFVASLALLALGAMLVAGAEPERESPAPVAGPTELAIFAGGCFWCMEPPFDALPGVVATTSGYTGGSQANPSYEQVSSGATGHLEAVRVEYDPKQVSYQKLLDVFWRNVDPTDDGGQFCDRGEQYTTAIFTTSEAQRAAAEASKQALSNDARLGRPIVTPIRAAAPFYAAEEYHQDYYEKNPLRYKVYRSGCGRDRVLERLWGTS